MKVAMFEGLKRARKLRRECRKGSHAACVKNRPAGARSAKQGAAQKAFKKVTKACAGKSASKFRNCVAQGMQKFKRNSKVRRFKR